jgi:hypothetical protein
LVILQEREHIMKTAKVPTDAGWDGVYFLLPFFSRSLVELDRRFRCSYFLLIIMASIIRRQYTPLKRRSTSSRLHGAIPRKDVISILAVERT